MPARLDDESLGVDFLAAGRGRLDDVPLGVDFFAALLDAVLLDGFELAPDGVSLAEPRGDFCSDP